MNKVLEEIYQIGIVPVIAIDDAKDAVPLAKALIDGGLPCAEVTFRTAAAEDAIAAMSKAFPEMLIGAGTVLTKEQVDRAVNAGAKFIVSPGLNPEVVRYCVEKNITVCPGCANPSDIEQAIALGLDTVKFFPAEAAGGLNMIKAMSAPYGNIKFMPTGGINAKNLNDYLAFKKIIACGGSFMVKSDLIKAGDFDKITTMTKEAVETMLGFNLKNIGINVGNVQEADLYGSIFAGTGIELGNSQSVDIATNNVDRAVYHLNKKGCEFDLSTAEYDNDKHLKSVCLKNEIGGFVLRLVKKNF